MFQFSLRAVRCAGLGLLLVAGASCPLSAQERERGERGERGERRGFDPAEMIQRMDANQNGQIDVEEMQGRSRFMLERMASEEQLDLTKPIAVSHLQEVMQRRMSRPPGGGPGGPGGPFGGPPPGGGFSPGGGFTPGGPPAGGSSFTPAVVTPTAPATPKGGIPGFGSQEKVAAVQGFGGAVPGASPVRSVETSRYSSDVLERVNDLLEDFDRDKSGALEQAEWDKVKWRGDPRDSDANRDGKLSREELLDRVARIVNEDKSKNGGSSSGSSSGGGKVDERIMRYADSMMTQYDSNKNGILEENEWKDMRGDPKSMDQNSDGRISREELAQRLAKYGGGGGGDRERGGDKERDRGSSSKSSSTAKTGTGPLRFLSPIERLPKGLPDWFGRNDIDADGQVMMHEFSSAWSDSKAAEFAKYDLNGDGVVTPAECLAAEKLAKTAGTTTSSSSSSGRPGGFGSGGGGFSRGGSDRK